MIRIIHKICYGRGCAGCNGTGLVDVRVTVRMGGK